MINKFLGVIKKRVSSADRTEKSAVASMLLRPVNLILGLLYTPLLLDYLGTEYYGLWVTILSVISWINYFDVGIGHGLRNLLAAELSKEKQDNVKSIVSTAYVLLTIISGSILLILIILVFTMKWGAVFSTEIDMRLPLFISFVFICINFVLALSNAILYAMQKAELLSLRNIYVQVINISGVFALRLLTKSNLVYVSILFGTSTMLVYLYNSYKIYKINKLLKPSIKSFDRKYISSVCSVGIKFFVIQIMCLAMFTVDNMLITHYFGAEIVTPFSIVDKIFNTAYSVWAAFLVPYWSGTTAAVAEKNITWITDSLKKVSKLFSLFFVGFIILNFLFKPIARIWLHKELNYQIGVIPLMCVFYIFYSILAIECQFINGTGRINTQLVLYIFLGLANIPLSIFLGVNQGLGPFGVRLATTILVFIEIIVLGFNLRNIIMSLKLETIKEDNCI